MLYRLLLILALALFVAAPANAGEWTLLSSTKIDFDYDRNGGVSGNNYNARLSSELIDGYMLMPGEIFSFNRTLGPRTTGKGYVTGLNTVGAPTVGGGICRTSTVLFQAARAGGLRIIERHPHYPAVAYASQRDDATINWGWCDLKFKNTLAVPVMIRSGMEQGEKKLHLWSAIFIPGNGPAVNVTVNDAFTFNGTLHNGRTFAPADVLASLYGIEYTLENSKGLFSVRVGEKFYREKDGNLTRNGDRVSVPIREWVNLLGGELTWIPGASPQVVMALPAFPAGDCREEPAGDNPCVDSSRMVIEVPQAEVLPEVIPE